MAEAPGDITLLLSQIRAGNRDAESKLMPLVYAELRRLARRYMRSERADHTLQPTALVHEAYLGLLGQREKNWQDRNHFFAMAAKQMRRILVDHARAHRSEKRGGDQGRVQLEDALIYSPEKSAQIVALDEALKRLAKQDPRQAEAVELRFFGGLSEEEVAAIQGVSTRTVMRDWAVAKAWLYSEISDAR